MGLFFSLLFLTLATLVVCYGVGAGLAQLLRVAPHELWFTLFLRLVLGLIVLTVGYATVRTGGSTVLWPLPLLLLAAVWQLRSTSVAANTPLATSRAIRGLGAVLITGVVIFAARWLLLYDPASPFLRTPFQDYVYYGRLSLSLNEFGIETSRLPNLHPELLVPTPYHYLEVWLNALLVRLTSLPATWTLYLGTYSVLVTAVVVGLRAVLAQVGLRGWPAAVLALVLVLATGVYWPFFAHHSFLHNGVLLASTLLPVQPKTAPVYLLVLLGGLLLLQARYRAAVLVLAGLPVVFVSTAPASLLALLGLGLYLHHTRRLSTATTWQVGALVTFALLLSAGFYLCESRSCLALADGRLASSWWPAQQEWHTVLNIGIGAVLNLGIYYAPYATLLLVLWFAARQVPAVPVAPTADIYWPLLCWLLLLVLGGAAARSLAMHLIDSVQVFSNIVIPAATLGLAVGLGANLAQLPKTWTYGTAAVLLGLAGVNGYKLFSLAQPLHQPTRFSPLFLRQVRTALPSTNACGGFLLADSEYKTPYVLNPDAYIVGSYVANFSNNYALISLSSPDPAQAAQDPRFRSDTAYARFVSRATDFYYWKRKALPGHFRRDSAQYLFARSQGLQFLCLSRQAHLPTLFNQIVQAAYVDAWSGEKFYLLRPAANRSDKGL